MTSCRKESNEDAQVEKQKEAYFTTSPVLPPNLLENQLGNEATEFLKSQAGSAIHWQPYTPQVLADAEQAQRLLFVLVGSTAYPESRFAAELLAEEEADSINEAFVPVLVDLELDPYLRDIGSILATEQAISTSFPYAFFMTHEGNLVTFFPFPSPEPANVLDVFRSSRGVVSLIQEESFRYLIENSRSDNEKRTRRLQTFVFPNDKQKDGEETDLAMKEHSRQDIFQAAQRLLDLYDPVDRDFDNLGGVLPAELLSTLIHVSAHPAAPRRLSSGAPRATHETLNLLIRAAVRDPLDGYFFVRRASPSYAIPIYAKQLPTQSELLTALALTESTELFLYAEEQLLQALQEDTMTSRSTRTLAEARQAYTWSKPALDNLLNEEEYALALQAFKLAELGNIPNGDDPLGVYFRKNSLGLKKSPTELAKAVGLPREKSDLLLASVLTKLAQNREERLLKNGTLLNETVKTLKTQGQLLGALSQSNRVRPSPDKRAQADQIAASLIADYRSPDGGLRRVPTGSEARSLPAQAIDYVRAADGLLKYYRLSGDPEALSFVKAIVGELLDHFLDDDGYLFEKPFENRVLGLPVYNTTMLFESSTWGLGLSILNQVASLGFEHPRLEEACAAMGTFLDEVTIRAPLLHLDHLVNRILHQPRLVILTSEGNLEALRKRLSAPEFESILLVAEGPATSKLPPLDGQAAILIQNGETVQSWSRVSRIPDDLKDYLSEN